MASRPTAGDSKHLNIESERLAISLAISIEEGDADKFGDIYDSSIPAEFGQNKVESIKERVRELLEHPEELETLKADFQAADDLMSKLSQTFLGNDFGSLSNSLNGLKSEDLACYSPSDVNHNFCSVSGSVSMEGREELVSNKNVSLNEKGTCPVGARTDNVSVTSDRGKALSLKKHGTFSSNSHMRDNDIQLEVMSVRSTSEEKHKQKPEQVDDKIHFGPKLHTAKENSVSPVKLKRDILPTKKNVKATDHTDGVNTVGPHSPHKLLGNAVNLIGKPSEADLKNCPDPEPIYQNHRADVLVTESTPILGHSKLERSAKIPQKRQGEQQREREVEDVYPDDNPVLSPTVPPNFCLYSNYGTMKASHLPGDESMSKTDDTKIEDSNAVNREAVRKKKRKKKKKNKPGDNGAESTTEGEEVKSSSTEVIKPPSLSSDRSSTRKISAESSSERENLSGESDSKVHQTPDKRIDLKEKLSDKNTRTKDSGVSKKKKGEQRRKKGNEESLESVNKAINSKEDDAEDKKEECEVQKEDEQNNFGSKKESSVFALRRRAADDASSFHSNSEHVKENDCRAAMSDPGENDDGDGEFNVVTNRRSRRRPKEAGHFGHQGYASRNFLFYDPGGPRYDRSQDAPWYIRKSSSLPKEMCNYSSARKRLGTNEAEEPISTTTTTTTASSRRDSLESDENIDQKRFSYASKLKVNIQASVQSGPDANRDIAGNKEVLDTASSQSNSKPKIYSISNDKKDTSFDLLVHPPTGSTQVNESPPSSSITSAMNLEVGLGNSSHKFDLNFPNLTGNKSKDNANTGGEKGETRCVQYLDLECTNNTYAGRVKQSLGKSNKMALHPASEAEKSDDNLRTTGSSPEMAKSQTGQEYTLEETLIPLLANQEKELSCLNHVKPKIGDSESGSANDTVFEGNMEHGSNMGYTAYKSNIETESCARFMGTDLQGSQVGGDFQPSHQLPSSESTSVSNPIWFGSLLVSENQIVILNDSDHLQDNLPPERGWIPENSSHVAQVKDKDFVVEDRKTLSPQVSGNKGEIEKVEDSVSVELMSGLVVKIVTGDHGVSTGKFNLARVREMLLKDWEKTVQQGQEFPETVKHILD
ncbi:hypothetical protein HOLleu_10653 [Holothuria leucospilota]|uniref:Uncharacterized protein n=1 Tax=Holothuria leucospilota TaxID=206669 RepID=A0A9Q1CDY0_HOLLE|nr:hypothetical protein HOLleu_10653 [Holothuria leucospilota]